MALEISSWDMSAVLLLPQYILCPPASLAEKSEPKKA